MTSDITSQSHTKSQRQAYAADQCDAIDVDVPVNLSDAMAAIGSIQANLEAYKSKFHPNKSSKPSASDQGKK